MKDNLFTTDRERSQLGELVGNLEFELERVKDLQYLDKVYDVFYLSTGSGDRFILKKDKQGYEGRVYAEVFSQDALAVPYYLGTFQDKYLQNWLLIECVGERDMRAGALDQYLLLAQNLADVHSSFWGAKVEGYPFLMSKFAKMGKELAFCESVANSKERLSEEIVDLIKFVGKRLMERPQTLIHDDLLPINAIIGSEDVFLIDWQNAKKGCYAHDLGRLLGDLQDENGSFWVNPIWREQILRAYYEASCLVSEGITWGEFQIDFHCACVWNYAEIVIAHLRNGWDLGQWFERNYELLESIY